MAELPSGTITFLFTDIEGSTRLWEEHPEAMRGALARHDEILREALTVEGGHIFKTVGDSFCVAFDRASDAVAAAWRAQRALQQETWPDLDSMPVRMALYTGEAEARDDDYFGPPLNRCARILAAAHGGQILLSQTTASSLADEALPEGMRLDPLGEHRLRDLIQPEELLQLSHPELPCDFPRLRCLAAFAHNLPAQMTELVGREEAVEDVRQRLSETRLLTLSGTGGAGKTRLSLHVGAELLDEYPDGVWFIELAAISDASLIPQVLLTTLGIREQPGTTLLDTLTAALREKTLLLILDNCEHLVEACADVASWVLTTCPEVRVLATSRETLRVEGEVVWQVPSLGLPDRADGDAPSVVALTQAAAARLFIERARAVKGDFAVTDVNAPALAEVCWRLDGIPLAIELAAARLRMLTVEQIEERLDDRFRLLTGGKRTALPRHQTLRAAVEWSYDLLSEPERRVFVRLSVFVGGFTLEAAEAVCPGDGIEETQVLGLVATLVDKSLVVPRETEDGTRYRMLESLRAYAEERLDEGGAAEAARHRHADHFVSLAERTKPHLAGARHGEWLALLGGEHGNLRAALSWSLDNHITFALQLVSALRNFWLHRGHWSEAAAWSARCLAGEAHVAPELRADALVCAGIMAYYRADYGPATELFEEALELSQRIGYRASMANALDNLGNIAQRQGEYSTALSRREEALAIRREAGDEEAIAVSLSGIGWMATEQGDYVHARARLAEAVRLLENSGSDALVARTLNALACVADRQGDTDEARSLYDRSLKLCNEVGNEWGAAQVLINLGVMADSEGDYARARARYDEALVVHRRIGAKMDIAICLRNLAGVSQQEGDYAEAERTCRESLMMAREMGDCASILGGLEGLASLARHRGSPKRGGRLFGACQAVRDATGLTVISFLVDDYQVEMDATRTALGDEAFDAAWVEGAAMTLEEAVEYALGDGSDSNLGGPRSVADD